MTFLENSSDPTGLLQPMDFKFQNRVINVLYVFMS